MGIAWHLAAMLGLGLLIPMQRFASPGVTPPASSQYITESGDNYITETGANNYVTES